MLRDLVCSALILGQRSSFLQWVTNNKKDTQPITVLRIKDCSSLNGTCILSSIQPCLRDIMEGETEIL